MSIGLLFLIALAIVIVIGFVKKMFKAALTAVVLVVIYLILAYMGIVPPVSL